MRKTSRWVTAVCATALLTGFGGVAWAQDPVDDEDVEINVDADDEDVAIQADEDEYGYDEKEPGLMTGFGTAVQIGGGAFGFTNDDTADFMDTGGSWTARLVFGTRMPLALEAAYVGTANNISALGLDDDAVLMSHGAEANLRWNILSTFFRAVDLGFGHVDPYVFSGVGYRRYNLINDDFNTSNVVDSDNLGEVPVGGGIALSMGGFSIDTRGEYRIAFGDDLFVGDGDNQNELNTWNVSARLGWEF
jgi:hypothetical protein